jgi:hypothetical protein
VRCFEVPDEGVLVEWAFGPTDVLKPDGTPLDEGGTFYLLDSAGTVVQSWSTTESAVQEHFSKLAYVVEGDALVCYLHDVRWRHEDEPTLSRSVELSGLRELEGEAAPFEAAARATIESHEAERRRAWAEHEGTERKRLASFERALPQLGANETVALRWRYDGPDVVIERSTGEELWRDKDWPWMGKTLYRRLRRIAAEKYGDRLVDFDVDVPADEYLRFDND